MIDEVLTNLNFVKGFLKENYPNGYQGNGIYPLYLFYDIKKGYYTKELTSGVQNAYWVFSNKKFDTWEDMYSDFLHKF